MRLLNKYLYLLTGGLTFLSFSCKKDFLQRDLSVVVDENAVFQDTLLAENFATNSYAFLIDDYARLNGSNKGMTGQFTDESISNNNESFVSSMTAGNYLSTQATEIVTIYGQMYKGIRNANTTLARLDDYEGNWWKRSRIRGEQLFLRAFYYFELVKRFGGVVIIDKPQPVSEATTDLPRNSYEETVAFILKDLNNAIELLPDEYLDKRYSGRATKGAAMALKSRLLLLDASPLRNPENNTDKWRVAAEAAAAVKLINKYKLEDSYADVLVLPASEEYIMIKPRAPRVLQGYLKDFIMPASYGGAQSTISPTQNHVNLYGMQATGLPIGDPLSGYDENNPYVGRDPRFYVNILYNGSSWQGRAVETFIGGRDVRGDNVTKTSYYVKRLWPESVRSTVSNSQGRVNFIFFRYAEILLNLAEARNEQLSAPDQEVYDAINEVRNRAGMPDLENLDKDKMRERIRDERAVEFAFEEMRWWDVLRWKAGAEIVDQTLYGMKIDKVGNTLTYQEVPLESAHQRPGFQERWHWYPIPLAEIRKSTGALEQSPEWK
ncbi:RagB/SusD family nutrient uptake outer membrane protein [Desertivirga xinjiangensis]|uniref:RagB/SusD family nutrient uptake outer membrane protein n=1 Tax=Desertivirga xinjiangensis TaxID=539206 RepID=UPI00210BC128|nr:RagB/SusD family nutrient uptake outer membrane protein [Pedobacter xinjiangensis]